MDNKFDNIFYERLTSNFIRVMQKAYDNVFGSDNMYTEKLDMSFVDKVKNINLQNWADMHFENATYNYISCNVFGDGLLQLFTIAFEKLKNGDTFIFDLDFDNEKVNKAFLDALELMSFDNLERYANNKLSSGYTYIVDNINAKIKQALDKASK